MHTGETEASAADGWERARLGARARLLAAQAGIDATFVQADVLDLPADLGDAFDLVVASYGVFTWIGDLDLWARSAARALRPTGRLVVVDMHPLAQMIEQRDPLVVDFPYADDGPHRTSSESTYANPAAVLRAQTTVQWAHSLGEIVTALTGAGLRLELLHEHLSTDRDDRPGVFALGDDGRWRLQVWDQDLPVLFSLTATKNCPAEGIRSVQARG
ncbi:class I SAM-dependent methyltransferase [Frankia sp. Cas4]|uniref:class I SAM-dependent methyltransferase n=1 Tax=Frankia sp. Cas4 TaxID=3073927 RepID=UPI002AD33522|nr:class I SAM-dependent methyltransferase [Frankia sp. Cas4]